eukprot:gnl/MRDRNA2_/MRDRNA2_43992_c0_seq1.p1 gnl/MRDRNA2_/MRDRNA2_43992_c0~~gnl/MRDRNA2_/MRDRNA2_43992_c0_seq1.p1  ORF type:complete len:420 (+),score=69.11 gnl/MRDRNA2_/MRDRNA2_43992_c0_seq1:69-1328(+)
MDSQSIGPIGALLRQEALLRQKRLLHRQQHVVGDVRSRRATDGILGSKRPSISTSQDDRRQSFRAGIVSNARPVPSQSVGARRNSLGVSRCPGTRTSERRQSLQEASSRNRRSSCDVGQRQRRSSLESETSMETSLEFMPRPRRSSLDSHASSELGSRQRRETMQTGEVSHQWRQFLQRNRDFTVNKEKALESKRKAKQEELDKACTFAPKVHEWSLKCEEGEGEPCSTENSISCSEGARPQIDTECSGAAQPEVEIRATVSRYGVDQDLTSLSTREDLCEAPAGTQETAAQVTDQHQVIDTSLHSKLPLEAWNAEEEKVVAVESNPGPARLSCSPCGKLVVSNLASEVTLHDAWPRARLLFSDCDDEKKLLNVSATASTEVSNCPSEAGGADNEEDDDLDTLVANLRSHKVYSFHFSG